MAGSTDDGGVLPPCPQTPCGTGRLCWKGECIPDNGTCMSDDDCQGDTFCTERTCVPYGPPRKGNDPACKGGGFTAEKFEAPMVRCQWAQSAVIMAPVVADLNADGQPEIVLVTFDGGRLVALRGDNCQEVFSNASAGLGTRSQLAVGDLNGDKVPELVGVDTAGKIVVFDNKGQKVATSANAAQTGPQSWKDGGAALVNLDGMGPPEIVYGGMAVRLQGNQLQELYNVRVDGGHWGILTAAADIDGDGKPELLTGNRVLDGLTGADRTPQGVSAFPPGYVAVAQFDKATPEPEVVLISSQTGTPGTLRIYNPKTGAVVLGPYSFGQQWGGPPTVADFDGDGEPEVGSAGYTGYAVFDMECAKNPLPAFCMAPGIRWLKETRDNSSGSTGSSVFDFNGDGQAEVVYRDECWLRVYDGKTGQVRFAQSITSGTILELPVIADSNNDGHADIIVPAHNIGGGCPRESELNLPPGAGNQGIFVLQDPKNRWMRSRPIWNQHTYHITNVNDDGTIPTSEAPNWASWNNYRQNVQGMVQGEAPAPDHTGRRWDQPDQSDCVTRWNLTASICNRGASTSAAGIPGSFYRGDPRSGGQLLCTGTTRNPAGPGTCQPVSCELRNPPSGPIDLWFAADDDGTRNGREVECKEKNNLLHPRGAQCSNPPG